MNKPNIDTNITHSSSFQNGSNHYFDSMLSTRFNFLKTTEPLRGDNLLVNTNSLGDPGTYFINLGKTES